MGFVKGAAVLRALNYGMKAPTVSGHDVSSKSLVDGVGVGVLCALVVVGDVFDSLVLYLVAIEWLVCACLGATGACFRVF